ncbi:MAG: hypothetical protein AAB738_03590 [Patescibacteria group bacterium]
MPKVNSAEVEDSPGTRAKQMIGNVVDDIFADSRVARNFVFKNLSPADREKYKRPDAVPYEGMIDAMKEKLVEDMTIEPRVDTVENAAQFLKGEVQGMGHEENELEFAEGFADFRRNSRMASEIRQRVEEALAQKQKKPGWPDKKGEKVSFEPRDGRVMRGIFLRAILDSGMEYQSIQNIFDLAGEFEEASGTEVIEGYKDLLMEVISALEVSSDPKKISEGNAMLFGLEKFGWDFQSEMGKVVVLEKKLQKKGDKV